MKSSTSIGNFWVDLTRITLYLLLPLAIVLSVVQMQQGTIQNFDGVPGGDDARGHGLRQRRSSAPTASR